VPRWAYDLSWSSQLYVGHGHSLRWELCEGSFVLSSKQATSQLLKTFGRMLSAECWVKLKPGFQCSWRHQDRFEMFKTDSRCSDVLESALELCCRRPFAGLLQLPMVRRPCANASHQCSALLWGNGAAGRTGGNRSISFHDHSCLHLPIRLHLVYSYLTARSSHA
jgi:hypothetical protein